MACRHNAAHAAPEDGPSTIRIAFTTDERFVHNTAIALRSILAHATLPVEILILHHDLGETTCSNLRAICEGFKAFTSFAVVDLEKLRDLPILTPLTSRATYFRLLLPDVAPQDWDKVLYLDSDIVCCGDIAPLWNIDVSGHLVACVREPLRHIERPRRIWRMLFPSRDEVRSLGDADYFNSGVLLINLPRWRVENVSGRVLDWRRANSRNTRLHDQDALNAIIGANWLQLSARWNFQPAFLWLTKFRFAHHRRRLNPVLHHLSKEQGTEDAKSLARYHLGKTPWAARKKLGPARRIDRSTIRNWLRWRLLMILTVCHPFRLGPPTEFGNPAPPRLPD